MTVAAMRDRRSRARDGARGRAEVETTDRFALAEPATASRLKGAAFVASCVEGIGIDRE